MRIVRSIALMAVMGMTIGCDQFTKHLATKALSSSTPQSFLADTVRFEYVENEGAFLSLGADWPAGIRTALFTIGPALLLIFALAIATRYRWSGLARLGCGLLVAGGMSNIADRVLHGSVVDFVNMGIGPFRTGIFNVADAAVLMGAGLLVWARPGLGASNPEG